jgi:hypothetical protein
MNGKDIIRAFLRANRFEGLFCTEVECGCGIDDLAPCDGDMGRCFPGYKCMVEDPNGGSEKVEGYGPIRDNERFGQPLSCAVHKHEFKIWGSFLGAICRGDKTFEIRKKDGRIISQGDILLLREFKPDWIDPRRSKASKRGSYTGAQIRVVVTYIQDDFPGIRQGYAVLGIRRIGNPEEDSE